MLHVKWNIKLFSQHMGVYVMSSQLINQQTDMFLPFMKDASHCEQSLHELNMMWRMIESSAKMNCPEESHTIIPTITAAKDGFQQLEKELIGNLVQQNIDNVVLEIATKAHYVIDLVVRNLYERTADVGFLSTDEELCLFVAGETHQKDQIIQRLRAYQKKYTVYDEIILLDAEGHLLANIDESTLIRHSDDPLIQSTLACDSYVETFRKTDLRPNNDRALIYSQRMCHPETGEIVGVLCLCFHFEEEMQSIFASHRPENAYFNMLLLDGDNKVIASADPLWIPIGTKVATNPDNKPDILFFSGREYLISTALSAGYQGYAGPAGWQGQLMIPVDVAFTQRGTEYLDNLASHYKKGLLSHAKTFCPPLFDIMMAAKTIQRIVWNGQVMTASREGNVIHLKAILEQINETGKHSDTVFTQSINDLYRAVLTSSLKESELTTNLLVDVLDRNLYERANDCRWWALTPLLKATLAKSHITSEDQQKMQSILDYINSLYTVYTCIFVYDYQGQIIAATGAQGTEMIGTHISEQQLHDVLMLPDSQSYAVSQFEQTPLYADEPTYIYHAGIRHPDTQQVIGGIGIVFDAKPELDSMLKGGISSQKNTLALFVDRHGHVLSSTDDAYPTGSQLDIDAQLLQLSNGSSYATLTSHQGQYALVACTANHGYREFKTTDQYKEDVIAVVIQYFGQINTLTVTQEKQYQLQHHMNGKEYGTFFIDQHLFAMNSQDIAQAVSYDKLVKTTMGNRPEQIGILSLDNAQHKAFVWVFDLSYLIKGKHSQISNNSQIIILKHHGTALGILVDELHAVTQFAENAIMPVPFSRSKEDMLVSHIIQANEGDILIQCLDLSRLFELITTGAISAPEDVAKQLLVA